MTLQNKHFLVTGAGSGIGRSVSVALAAEGARVSLLGRDLTKLATTAAMIGAAAGDAFSVDLAFPEAITRFTRQFVERDFPLHGLVHAAGVFHRGLISDAISTHGGELLTANACGPLLLTSALLPLLRLAHADVVFVNSTAALHGVAGVAEYSMSKAAIRAFADSLRAEENAQGLRVMTVYVGRTATPMQEQVAREEGRAYYPGRMLQPADVATVVIAALTLPHSAEVTDLHIRPNMPPA